MCYTREKHTDFQWSCNIRPVTIKLHWTALGGT